MSQEQKFFICKHCGNLVGMIHNAGVKIICCGEPMAELVPNTTDAAGEKHLPVVEVSGKQVTVSVGSVPHPMTEEHHIAWVYLQTAKGGQRKSLPVGGEPKVTFLLEDDEPVAAFAYCNLARPLEDRGLIGRSREGGRMAALFAQEDSGLWEPRDCAIVRLKTI